MRYCPLYMPRFRAISWLCAVTFVGCGAAFSAPAPTPEGLVFFEKKIRPVLAEHCYECHSKDAKKVKGGLLADTREGLLKGGDTGPAVVPGDLDQSLLIKAVRYRDKDFQMPPKRKLSSEQIANFEEWVKMGAPDPRAGSATVAKSAINIEAGRKFWAYQLPQKPALPAVQDQSWPRNDIDRFILAKLEAKKLKPNADADKATLARRLYYDLTGLPPTPEEIDAFLADHSPDAVARLVDRLLASPHFGERWGRHWLDVARFAESMTLRGFVFKNAWRYRDYVIDTFNQDRPFDQFVREQISGDLMPYNSLEEHQRHLSGTTFLVMGNTNLEEQDKKQLRMDAVDEQLDTIGKAFLAQTIGCARCHDHKFDPIPTRDYYALAGILRNTKTLEHANVSKWLEIPMPLPPEQEKNYQSQEENITSLETQIKEAKALMTKLGSPSAKSGKLKEGAVAVSSLAGIVVDDPKAKRVGEWRESRSVKQFIGDGYLTDNNEGKGTKTLTFIPELPHAGKYEVRFAYATGLNRCADVPVTVFSADGETTIHVDEREAPLIDDRFVSLGKFKFEVNGQGFVIVSNEGTKGYVIADAVQFIPVEMLDEPAVAKADAPAADPSPKEKNAAEIKKASENLKHLEAEMKKLNDDAPKRPTIMSVKEEDDMGDTQVHVRGSVHSLGDTVPRGFLQVATYGPMPAFTAKESGRLELGEWLASPQNPLTARVIVNRAWHWLFGEGIVRTMDNFGSTGELPSHPELLDYLATRFVAEGWSMKKLVREIVLSRAYQLDSAYDHSVAANQVDPDNHLFWHAEHRRMEAECLRDTILTVSGQLKLDIGGNTIPAKVNADYGFSYTEPRRSIYVPVFRNALPEIFEAFDFADPSVTTGRRNASTVSPQALFLLNHPFVMEQAKLSAKQLLASAQYDDKARIEKAYRTALGRLPTDGELNVALKFVSDPNVNGDEAKRLEAWTQFYQALFASMDFRYLN